VYQSIKILENLSFGVALKKLFLIADRLNLRHVGVFIYTNDKYHAEVFHDDLGNYTHLFEQWKPVKESLVEKIIQQLTYKKIAKEKFGVDIILNIN
jgi:hypothetical protein